MSVIAKFQCHLNEGKAQPEAEGQTASSARIKLGAVWEGSTEKQRSSENAIFGYWTPCGAIDIHIMNPAAAEFFQPGKKYYVTFTEAPD